MKPKYSPELINKKTPDEQMRDTNKALESHRIRKAQGFENPTVSISQDGMTIRPIKNLGVAGGKKGKK